MSDITFTAYNANNSTVIYSLEKFYKAREVDLVVSKMQQKISALEAENTELRGRVVTSRKKEFWIEPLDKKRTCVENAFEKGSLKEALAWLSQKYVCKSYKIIVYRGSKRTSCCGTVVEKLDPIEEYVWCEGKGIVKQEATDE